MTKYINADELKNAFANWKEIVDNPYDLSPSVEECKAVIDAQPAADVVEVVRCKDCKHKYGYKCDYDDRPVGRGDYCSRGDRRDEVEENE